MEKSFTEVLKTAARGS